MKHSEIDLTIKTIFLVAVVVMLLYSLFINILVYASIPFLEHVSQNVEDKVIEVYESKTKLLWDQFRLDASTFYLNNKLYITLFWGVLNLLFLLFFSINKFPKPFLYLTSFYVVWALFSMTQYVWLWIPTTKVGFIIWAVGKVIEIPLILAVARTSRQVKYVFRGIGKMLKNLTLEKS